MKNIRLDIFLSLRALSHLWLVISRLLCSHDWWYGFHWIKRDFWIPVLDFISASMYYSYNHNCMLEVIFHQGMCSALYLPNLGAFFQVVPYRYNYFTMRYSYTMGYKMKIHHLIYIVWGLLYSNYAVIYLYF